MTEPPASGRESADPECDVTCYCRLDGLMDLLSRQAAMQVVCVVGAIGPARYGDVEAAFGDVSSSTLSARLADLDEAGLLDRQQYDEIPPRVEYDLTPAGEELCEQLRPVLEWADGREELPGDGEPGGS